MEGGLKIGDVCRLYGITPDTLRHYEAKGLVAPRRDPANGYRYYSAAQLDVIELILAARTLGIPLAELGRVIASEDVRMYRALYARQERLLAEKITALRRLLRVAAAKGAELDALAAYERGEPMPAQDQALYLVPIEILFAVEARGEEMAGLESLTTWRLFARDEAGALHEDGQIVGLSFSAEGAHSALAQGFAELADAGKAQRLTLAAEQFRSSFWGDDDDLQGRLAQTEGARFFVRIRYLLPRREKSQVYFADIFVGDSTHL